MRYLQFIGLLTVLVCSLPLPAAITFTGDMIIASKEKKAQGRFGLDAPAPGDVIIAWMDQNSAVHYSRIDFGKPGTKPVLVNDGEVVCASAHQILGLRRDNTGVVRLGLNNGKYQVEWTREENGKWSASNTGVQAAQYYAALGGYDVNRQTGLGAFFTLDSEQRSVLIYKDEFDQWRRKVLARDQSPISRGALTITPDGEPAVAYQMLNSQPTMIKAGLPEKLGQATNQANTYYPLAIAADADTLYLIVSLNVASIICYTSKDGGATWTQAGQLASRSSYGDGAHIAAAAALRGGKVAALIPDGTVEEGYALAVSTDSGRTWEKQTLPGASTQSSSLGFDADGELYVVYLNGNDKAVHLLTTRK